MIPKIEKNKKDKSYKEIIFWVVIVIVAITLISILVSGNIRMKNKREEYNSQIELLKKQIEETERKTKELEKGVSQAGSKEQLEKIAREQLGLKAPGEEVVVISKEEDEQENFSVKKEEDEQENQSFLNPRTWWEWIVGNE
ncbi:MAG: septum formation initiator family protein [Candidatus Nealsonbacteria bacterium]